ncbi:MAG: response regulator transcription factor [Bacteroidota bacterium]
MLSTTKIILVDDHLLFREGLKLLIEREGMGEVIAEAENGKVFLELLETHDPDLVLMDIEMPVMDGLEAIRKALAIRPGLKILVFTIFYEREYFDAMINSGAMGFVLKSSGKQELEKAIRTVIRGEYYFQKGRLKC